jgi:hypothetical protein
MMGALLEAALHIALGWVLGLPAEALGALVVFQAQPTNHHLRRAAGGRSPPGRLTGGCARLPGTEEAMTYGVTSRIMLRRLAGTA